MRESTAFVVCNHYGIDTSEYTFPYLASWSSSKELDELKNSLETIQKQANELIGRIDIRLSELQKNIEFERQEEILDSIKFDNDIDLDREKTREQLGFKNQEVIQNKTSRVSMKERMNAAQTEADRRNNLQASKEQIQLGNTERGAI